MSLFAGVVVNSDALKVDKLFTYEVPDKFGPLIQKGHRIRVPFGKGNKTIEAFVMDLYNDYNGNISKLKAISEVCDENPLITEDDFSLIQFMREKYLCKYIEAIRVLIPTGIMKGNKIKTKKVICYGGAELQGNLNKPNYKNAVDIISENSGIYTRSELMDKFNLSAYTLSKLLENNIIFSDDEQVNRINTRKYETYSSKNLNMEQQQAVDAILSSKNKLILLKGVTGSGKTEVYMNLVSHMLNEDKTSLILVPEIALTPQMIERFKGRFGKNVAVFHSRLSDGERFDEWFRIKNGDVKLVIGARSAIFLPFDNLGLIVIDEEHEGTYKSEQNPKYHTREIAEFKSKLTGCTVVYGSATPSIESYFKALAGNMKLVELKNRVDNSSLPKMEVIDMREELSNNNKSMFSKKLYEAIQDRLEKKEQIIIFLNRRGYSTFVSCRKCGYVFKCPHCDIAMTYHTNGYLVCHYCGTAHRQQSECPSCSSKYVKYFGAGTEKLEIEITKLFPKARVLRMDVDTTRKKNSHEEIYNTFKNGNADILVGTQMISKGLDFPNVTLVGVITADISLNLPDFRSSERTYQLITQVGGRAGRGSKEGNVLVQSYNPEHYSLSYAKNNDYEGFYEEEIVLRKSMNYPPYSNIMLINLSSKNQVDLQKHCEKLGYSIKTELKDNDQVEVLGPCPCIIQRINEMYRWQILIKGNFELSLAHNIKDIVYELSNEVYNDIRISMDINPNNLV
ncbi:primosomal protein N' [Clostridium sp. YIM B02505]|uniref:Replication restart protein PriA n=1 Tax=Clostridium yunnanense TaxID=2800325 RepID=A0ABS1EMI0_9CLOT|nr:primosomal protein N' [Clostridium yunnanense]MBK1810607.1 primosomal protein N' [Clostridium yunnanense]